MTTIRFHTRWVAEDAVTLRRGRYEDGSTALLISDHTGEPICIPTVCLVDYDEKPADNHVFIKDYPSNDNEGTLQALQDAGVIGAAVRGVPFGPFDAKAYECPLITGVDEL